MALTDNLVSYWKLDESSGNAADSLSTNNLTNTNTVTYSGGKINNGADFASSSSQYLTKASASSLPLGVSARSFNLWFKSPDANTTDKNYTFIMYGTDSSKALQWFAFGNDGAGHSIIAWNGYASDVSRIVTLSANTWYMVTGTFDGTDARIYLNASLQGAAEDHSDWNTSGTTLSLGRSEQSGGIYYFNGSLDEVGIWSRALSGTEITTLYNSGDGLQYPFSTSAIKTINGLAKASVKTVNGLAIASVKTFNGLA